MLRVRDRRRVEQAITIACVAMPSSSLAHVREAIASARPLRQVGFAVEHVAALPSSAAPT